MNSINQNQPEDNFKDLSGQEAIAKLKQLAEGAATCFFVSNIKTGLPVSARPMTVQDVDDEGNLWFLMANDSNTYHELEAEPLAQLFFQGSKYSDYLNVYGLVELSRDKEKIKQFWKATLNTWFTEGENDPRIAVVKVEPTEAHYWDNKNGNAVAFIKQLAGAAIGKTLDDSVEGKLDIL
ncbi:pyridoxamine 5'-phosphate oxidase family protein [Mucilaginibacter panaciglaebae]|uniref:General stress protein FMN-binding split barrel domain-containing protein n=1 Tax=Mucilaginibacter panaciglaebae TaxID=502331 RepID=A0ABP7WGA4_9SPHI